MPATESAIDLADALGGVFAGRADPTTADAALAHAKRELTAGRLPAVRIDGQPLAPAALAARRASAGLSARVAALVERQKAGGLTRVEAEELAAALRVDHVATLLKAAARLAN